MKTSEQLHDPAALLTGQEAGWAPEPLVQLLVQCTITRTVTTSD
jgi:hypothetical protein